MTPSFTDTCIAQLDIALRTMTGTPTGSAATATATTFPPPPVLDTAATALSARLMRVDHVGEVCAQALYQAQALATPDAGLKTHFLQAAAEERRHLDWTAQRLIELGGRPSLLNPLWYAGAFALGLAAGRLGNAMSLGFVTHTETLVEAHIDEHLQRLPAEDLRSRAILMQMKADEIRHAEQAQAAGGRDIPAPLRWAMRTMGKIMTVTAERI